MEKLKQLLAYCKNSVSIDVNDHRDVYESVEQYVSEWGNRDEVEDIEKDVFDKMKETDTCIKIQFYPETAIGFHVVWHYDIEKAIDECLDILNSEK